MTLIMEERADEQIQYDPSDYQRDTGSLPQFQSMEQVNELVLGPAERLPQAVNPGLQLIRASELEADQISQLISGACPPFSLDHSDFVCQEHDCQECWKAWLLTGMPPKGEV